MLVHCCDNSEFPLGGSIKVHLILSNLKCELDCVLWMSWLYKFMMWDYSSEMDHFLIAINCGRYWCCFPMCSKGDSWMSVNVSCIHQIKYLACVGSFIFSLVVGCLWTSSSSFIPPSITLFGEETLSRAPWLNVHTAHSTQNLVIMGVCEHNIWICIHTNKMYYNY